MSDALPPGYHVSRDIDRRSRWIVSYQGDPFIFIRKTRFTESIQTFKTKRDAIQAVRDLTAKYAGYEMASKRAEEYNREIDERTRQNAAGRDKPWLPIVDGE